MQMYKKIKLFVQASKAILTSSVFLFALLSCKEAPPTTLEVLVVNTNGTEMANAKVWLVAEPTDTAHNAIAVNDSTTTDLVGKAYFDLSDFYQPGQLGVMQIKVKGFYFGLTGESIAEIIEQQRNKVLLQLE